MGAAIQINFPSNATYDLLDVSVAEDVLTYDEKIINSIISNSNLDHLKGNQELIISIIWTIYINTDYKNGIKDELFENYVKKNHSDLIENRVTQMDADQSSSGAVN